MCLIKERQVGDYTGPQWHKGQPAYGVGKGYVGIETSSGACSGAQNIAMCP